MTCRKNPKLQYVPKVFPMEALLVTQPPNVVPPKGNASKGKCVHQNLLPSHILSVDDYEDTFSQIHVGPEHRLAVEIVVTNAKFGV